VVGRFVLAQGIERVLLWLKGNEIVPGDDQYYQERGAQKSCEDLEQKLGVSLVTRMMRNLTCQIRTAGRPER